MVLHMRKDRLTADIEQVRLLQAANHDVDRPYHVNISWWKPLFLFYYSCSISLMYNSVSNVTMYLVVLSSLMLLLRSSIHMTSTGPSAW